jgi:acetyltransferase-like isoleucine patch superfamily enzyme
MYNIFMKIIRNIKKRNLDRSFKSCISLQIDVMKQRIITPEMINIGKDVFMGEGMYISAEVDIGDRVMFGPQCMILGGDHIFERLGEFTRYIKPLNNENIKKIVIEEDVWIGARVSILKGVRIGKGAVIGAGSIVNKNLPPYCVSAGNPCKIVRKIFSDEMLIQHLKLSKYSEDETKNIIKERNKFF